MGMGNGLVLYRSNPLQLTSALDSFMVRCRAKRVSVKTLSYYTWTLGSFRKFLLPHDPLVTEITADHIRQFLEDLNNKKLSSAVVFRMWGALRCFFGYLELNGVVPRNVMLFVDKPIEY